MDRTELIGPTKKQKPNQINQSEIYKSKKKTKITGLDAKQNPDWTGTEKKNRYQAQNTRTAIIQTIETKIVYSSNKAGWLAAWLTGWLLAAGWLASWRAETDWLAGWMAGYQPGG